VSLTLSSVAQAPSRVRHGDRQAFVTTYAWLEMLRIHAVGGFQVEVDGRERTSPTPDRATALLAWLALNPGNHRRSAVAARFWPDVLDDSARASLRSALWSLRRRLGDQANGALIATRDDVGLSDEVWVDVAEARRLRSEGLLDEALALADGELLPSLEDEWAYDARDEHRGWTVALLEELAVRAVGEGDNRAATRTEKEISNTKLQRANDTTLPKTRLRAPSPNP